MLVHRDFVYVDNTIQKNYASYGWLLANKPHFDPNVPHRAHVLIHDVLEHHNDDGDGIEFELMALGATYFIRVFGGWEWFRRGGEDHGETAQYNDVTYFLDLNKYQIEDCDVNICHELMDIYVKARIRFEDGYGSKNIDAFIKAFKWLSKGYHRAKARWTPHNSRDVLEKLWEPLWKEFYRDDIDTMFRHHGNTMRISFDTETLEYVIHLSGKESLYMGEPKLGKRIIKSKRFPQGIATA